MKVAIFGSRQGYDLDHLRGWLHSLWAKQGPTTELISGGADGVDTCAEATWISLGGVVTSYRPLRVNDFTQDDEYAIECWKLGAQPNMVFVVSDHPTWGDFTSAALYRDMVIAEEADRGVAFRHRKSRGTTLTMGFFAALDKPIHLYEEDTHGAQS